MANLKGILFFPARNTPTLSALCTVDCAHHFVMSLSPSGNGVNADDLCAHCDDHIYQHYGAFAMPVLPQDALYATVTARSPAYQKAQVTAPSGTSALTYITILRSELNASQMVMCAQCAFHPSSWCDVGNLKVGCALEDLCKTCKNHACHCNSYVSDAAPAEVVKIDAHRTLLNSSAPATLVWVKLETRSCDCGSSSSDPTHYTWCKSNG